MNQARRLRLTETSWNFFALTGTSPAYGRTFAPGDDTAGRNKLAVIGYGLWQQLFAGDPAAAAFGRYLRSVQGAEAATTQRRSSRSPSPSRSPPPQPGVAPATSPASTLRTSCERRQQIDRTGVTEERTNRSKGEGSIPSFVTRVDPFKGRGRYTDTSGFVMRQWRPSPASGSRADLLTSPSLPGYRPGSMPRDHSLGDYPDP